MRILSRSCIGCLRGFIGDWLLGYLVILEIMSWKFKLVSFLVLVGALFAVVKLKTTWLDEKKITVSKKNEAYFIEKLTEQLGGKSEVQVEGGRMDILTDEHAIEVEWASNWKESIGQSLWYAMQENKKPRIIMLLKKEVERKYFMMLNSALRHAKLEIETEYIRLYEIDDDDAELILRDR